MHARSFAGWAITPRSASQAAESKSIASADRMGGNSERASLRAPPGRNAHLHVEFLWRGSPNEDSV